MKYPEPGRVKTRLARQIGDCEACRVYRRMAEKIIEKTGSDGMDYERTIFYRPASAERRVRNWLAGEKVAPQRGADIGRIMENAFCDMFRGGAGMAIVAGVDIPGLDAHIVNEAFQELAYGDVVIGPALDGGYYLIGMKARQPDIFRGISWGTAGVFSETLRVIGNLGLTVRTVRAMNDVDTLDDLLKARNLYPEYFNGM